MPVRAVVPDCHIVLAPLEADLVVVVLGHKLRWSIRECRKGEEVNNRERTYIEEISKNNIRLILCKLHNALCETFVHEDALPTSDS
jgi:hypothetical protein